MTRSWQLVATICLVGCALEAAPHVSASPQQVVLGRDQRVRIRVRSGPKEGPLRWAASAGVLEQRDAETFLWTPPDIHYPSRALLMFWNERDPEQKPDPKVLQIPLLGRTDLEMNTDPGADVRVRLGGVEFGPVRANRRGVVRVPIEVPPGVRAAEVVATTEGQTTTRKIALDAPPSRALATSWTPGHVLIAHDREIPSSSISVVIADEADGSRIEPLSVRSNVSIYRVIPAPGVYQVQCAVRVDGKEAARVQGTFPDPGPGPESENAPIAAAVPAGEKDNLEFGTQAGLFVAGGANRGPAVEVDASYQLPYWGRRLYVELGAGFRTAEASPSLPSGKLVSRLMAFPLDIAGRARVVSWGEWALDARAGLGLLPFRVRIDSPLQDPFAESGLGFHAFAGAQGVYRVRATQLLADFRCDFARARTPRVDARPGGLMLSIGARWGLP